MKLKANSVLTLIGIAMKAGKVVSGEFSVENAVRKGKARLVIVADDASNNTKKNFQNICGYYRVPCEFFESKDNLGGAIGKKFRASIGITDEKLSIAIRDKIDQVNNEK